MSRGKEEVEGQEAGLKEEDGDGEAEEEERGRRGGRGGGERGGRRRMVMTRAYVCVRSIHVSYEEEDTCGEEWL